MEQQLQYKIISLNTWGGKMSDELKHFFEKNQDVDIFCLQEILNGGEHDADEIVDNAGDIVPKDYQLLKKIQEFLPNHKVYFRPHYKDYYGLAMFIKNNINITEEGEEFVHQYKGYIPEGDLGFHARNIQYTKIQHNEKSFYIINFHGLWNGKGKTDTEDRIQQSKNILQFIKNIKDDFVLCGDFNLLPDTESLKLIESLHVRNLIKDYNITSTRTSLYTKPERFADYVFVSQNITVTDFQILPDEVSDHAAMQLIISI